ncbi:MAG TPA: FxLYD domain-containing protein, partial [Verrucomicrobiae bacterium]|nr:FxLYD domain-containing protein [Verrucomicrobiae bacterium]
NAKQGKSVFPSRQSKRTYATTSSAARPAAQEETDATAESPKSNTAAAPKSVDDFKVSKITLQKTPGSSLVYAIGTLRNNSDYQRFGVRVELDLLDATGKKIGSTKDYVKIIEPRREWRFRALVLAPKTASVRVGKINEEE